MNKKPKPTKPKKSEPQKRVVKFEGVNKSGELPGGGRFRLTIGTIEISYEE